MANFDALLAEYDAAIETFALTGEAPIAIGHMPVVIAERDGSKVFLTVAGRNGDLIAGSRCDTHGQAIEYGCAC